MATNPIPLRWGANGRPNVQRFPLTAGQTFPYGACVKLSSGAVVVCAANDVSILGWADEPAEDVIVPGFVNVNLPDDDLEMEMECSSAPAAANIYPTGGPYGLNVTSGRPIIDLTDTTNDAFIITALHPRGTAYAKIISAARQAII